MKWLSVIIAGAALVAIGCTPCKGNAECRDGETCSAGTCQPIAACTSGQSSPCVCAGGGQGSQICNATGTAFGSCECTASCGAAGCAVMPDLVGKSVGEAGQALRDVGLKLPDPIDPNGFIIERRVSEPPAAVLEQFPVPGAKLSKGTAPMLRVTMPPDQEYLGLPNSSFLVGALAQDDEQSAQAYYDAIDPGAVPTRGTLANWKLANGFGEPADDEASAIYSNKLDLGFGRHMHMRRVEGRLAFYVDNFPTLEDAVNNTRNFATVAMEWSPPADDPAGRPFTKFFTFNRKGVRIYDPALDSHGIKLQPAVCLACHGGTVSDLEYKNGGNLGARFIPFDLDSLGYSTRRGYTRADQEAQFKKLNRAVQMTYLPDDPAYTAMDPPPAPALIDGWYGGPGMPGDTFDGTFVPPAWGVTNDAWDLYLDVFAKSCRTCHMQREPSRNFSTYDKFWNRQGLIHQRVFEDGAMPLSERGAMNFWLSSPSQPELLSKWLKKPLIGPGKPVARVRVTNNGLIRPGDRVALDASESQYSQKFTWSQASGPAVVLSAGTTTASFTAPSQAANVVIQLVTSYGSLTSTASLATAQIVDPPGAPTAVSATPGVRSATVHWTAPASNGNSALATYKVTSSLGGTTTVDASLTTVLVTGLADATAVRFTVTATNAAGLESAPSLPSGSQTTASPPGAPQTVTATPGDASALVSWLAPAIDGGSPVTGYTVTASPGGATASTAGALSATVSGLTNGASYTFTVVATTLVSNGTASAPSAAVTPRTVPGAPTAVSAVRGNAKATVSWTPPTSTGGSAILSYTLSAFTTTGCGSPPCATVISATATCASGPCSADVTGLTNGTGYQFTVKAVNVAGAGAVSAFSSAVTPATLPSAPTSVTASPGNGSVTVSWVTPSGNGASVTSYNVTSHNLIGSPDGTASATQASNCANANPGAACSATVLGLTNGTPYTFTVTATNAVGPSVASSASNVATPNTVVGAPSAPQSVSAVAGASTPQATVQWSSPVDPGTSSILSYLVTANFGETKLVSCGVVSGSCPTITTSCPANPISTAVTGLTGGRSYTFTVHATNCAGSGPESAASSAVAVVGPPQPPTGVGAVSGNGQATVSWTATTNSGGSSLTGYTVTALIGGSPSGITASATPGANCVSTACSVAVTGLTNGTAYTFTVTASNAIPATSVASSPSGTVTPAGAPLAPTSVSASGGNASATFNWTTGNYNGSTITSTTIYVYTTGTTCGAASFLTTRSPSPTCNSGSCSSPVTSLTNGTSYCFRVTNTNGISEGAFSAFAGPVTSSTVPGAPTSVSVTLNAAAISVSFGAPASTGGALIDFYRVDACSSGSTCGGGGVCSGGTLVQGTTGGGSPIAVSGLTTCAYSASTATCTKTYVVCTYAHNTNGYGTAVTSTGVAPKVSFQADNVGGIFTTNGCSACHGTTSHRFTNTYPTNYNDAVFEGPLIYTCPETGSCGSAWTGTMGSGWWTSGSAEGLTLRRWITNGSLQ